MKSKTLVLNALYIHKIIKGSLGVTYGDDSTMKTVLGQVLEKILQIILLWTDVNYFKKIETDNI